MRHEDHIDGLRAVAVLPVVFYHAGFRAFRGGFVGVDVFFVISGYLICALVLEDLAHGEFSFARFYERRARRILPALLAMIVAATIVAWLLFMPWEFVSFLESALASCFFVSNMLFARQAGYFDVAASMKPLLHTWSLSVEGQFYAFFPLFLYGAHRFFPTRVAAAIAAIAAASLFCCLALAGTRGGAGFYRLDARVWELSSGALCVFLRAAPRLALPASALGLCLILACVFGFDDKTPWPSAFTILPVAGACLVLLGGRAETKIRALLASRPFVFVGLLSYSLYLWHYPVFTFARRHMVEAPTGAHMLSLTPLCFGLAYASYRWIEIPFRRPNVVASSPFRRLAATTGLLAAGFCIGIYADGFPGRFDDASAQREFIDYFENGRPGLAYFEREGIIEKYRSDCNFYDIESWRAGRETTRPRAAIAASCYERDPAFRRAVFVWGDSYAQMLTYGLRRTLPSDWQLLMVTSSGCAPKLETSDAKDYCAVANRFALEEIARGRPDVVLLGQRARLDLEASREIVRALAARGVKNVVFAGTSPRWSAYLPTLIAQKFWPDTPFRASIGLDREVMEEEKRARREFERAGLRYFSIVDVFCDASGCITHLEGDRERGVTAWDDGHLPPAASVFLARSGLRDEILRGLE